MTSYAEVAVSAPGAPGQTFSYSIPPPLTLVPGQAVWVPFGPRVLQGLVFALSPLPQVSETREVREIIETTPLLSPAQIELARWMSRHYFCSLYEAAAPMLPPGFTRKVATYLEALESTVDESSLSPRQREVLQLVRQGGKVALEAVKKALGTRQASLVVAQMRRLGLLQERQEIEPARVRPKLVSQWRLAVSEREAQEQAQAFRQRGARRQAELLERLLVGGHPLRAAEVGPSLAPAARALVEKHLVVREEVRVRRQPTLLSPASPTPPPTLTGEQQVALGEIVSALQRLRQGETVEPRVFLLHGITGSGKTEVYLRALAETVSLGRRGLVLVPEIALTPQTIERFSARFPGQVAVLHSRLSLGERYDEWWRLKEGDCDVVIGSRGTIFAPQPGLGLIVLDEEHEWTYKQEDAPPRYHTREVAHRLAELTGAVVILGSATPAVESYYHARRSEYRLLELTQRVGTLAGEAGSQPRPLPKVEVVDLREEWKSGNRGLFSRSLVRAVEEALSAEEQVILFLNRRGAASTVQCRHCGLVLRCRRCDVPLTYHSQEGHLACHYCSSRQPLPEICPQCWHRSLRFLGSGTQRVEEEAAGLFPGARLLRWDLDVTKAPRSHERLLEKFRSRQADILIGTQMVAKGLDLPLVTVVGILNADLNLYLPDFRSAERAFQLMTQVAGRAGRGPGGGRAILQTYSPEHYTVKAAARHDFKAFYEKEIAYRREQGTPPFSRLARLLYLHTHAAACQKEAERLHRLLVRERDILGLPQVDFIGPAPAFPTRVRGHYRWHLLVRAPEPSILLERVPLPRGWTVDIDPVSVL